MDWEKKSGIPTTWKKIVWKIFASGNAIGDDSVESAIGKIGICDYLYFVVGAIVCEHDGRAYLVESDCGICLDDDGSRGKRICGSFCSKGGLV